MSMFFPRHHRFLADSLRRARSTEPYATDRMVIDALITRLIADLAQENPFFSEARFRETLDEKDEPNV